jgi:hypothetical protein
MTLVLIGGYEATKREKMMMKMLRKPQNYSLKKEIN